MRRGSTTVRMGVHHCGHASAEATASLYDLRRWASPADCGGRPHAFRCSLASPWWPGMALPRGHFDRAAGSSAHVRPTTKMSPLDVSVIVSSDVATTAARLPPRSAR